MNIQLTQNMVMVMKQNIPETIQENEFLFIDLFAGIGGFRIALEELRGKCIFSSEWDKKAQETYNANFNESPVGDITKISENEIPKHDVLCAGFPCQAFSISGKQQGFEDTRGTLFFDIARIASYHKPSVLLLENVKNFVNHDGGKTIKIVYDTLEKIGYDVYHEVLNASEYGIPQSRKRVYIVAFRKDLNIKDFHFPKPTFKKVKLKKFLQSNTKAKNQVVTKYKHLKIFNNEKPEKKSVFSPIRIGTINGGGQGERIYSTDGHAITLSAYGGGIASKTGAYLINGTVRKLTPRECANIMGFPPEFIIPVSDSQAYKQFGNSVAVPIVKRIFEEVTQTLEDCGKKTFISKRK
jgi:DNA (cytosine-5)-methyltransferase 1